MMTGKSGFGVKGFTTVLGALVCLTFMSCGKSTDSDPYRAEERALLKLSADSIIELEKAKDYARLYDEYASRDYKLRVSERKFLKLTHCVERHLGELQYVDPASIEFLRKTQGKRSIERLSMKVDRQHGTIDESYDLVDDGLGYRALSFRWLSNNTQFLACMKSITADESKKESKKQTP